MKYTGKYVVNLKGMERFQNVPCIIFAEMESESGKRFKITKIKKITPLATSELSKEYVEVFKKREIGRGRNESTISDIKPLGTGKELGAISE